MYAQARTTRGNVAGVNVMMKSVGGLSELNTLCEVNVPTRDPIY